MRVRVDQHDAVVHDRVAIASHAIFVGNHIIFDASGGQGRADDDALVPAIGRMALRDDIFAEARALVRAEQRGYARAHTLHYHVDEYPGERIVMTWAEARAAAARGHVFACHSRNHAAVTPDTPESVLQEEIVTAKHEMENGLGQEVDIFCWLHGAEVGINPRADDLLREAGYRYLFSNFRLQRLQ